MAAYLARSPIVQKDTRGREVPIPPARELLNRRGRRGQLHPARRFVDALEALEADLDSTWPGWRHYEPFADVEVGHAKRIKWLLKRRSLLLQCRDWGVSMITSVKHKGTRWFAHPVEPPRGDALREEYYARRDLWNPPPMPSTQRTATGRNALVHRLSADLAAPPEKVAAALATMPAGFSPDLWVRRALQRGGTP